MTRVASDDQAAELLRQHRAGEPFRPAEAGRLRSLQQAYAVQQAFVAALVASAGAPVGYKIGLTSTAMQQMCKIDQPVAGVVLSQRLRSSGCVLRLAEFGRLGLEFEIAMRIGHATTAQAAPYTASTIRPHVAAVAVAMELVDDRRADYQALDVLSLVADNAWNAGVVLGEFCTAWPVLSGVEGVVTLGDQVMDRGHGRDVLGDPFAATAWLANHLAGHGEALAAGQLVMTGSLVRTVFPTQAGDYRFTIEGLGAVTARIEAGDAAR